MKQETFTDMTKLCLQTERHQKLLTTLLKKVNHLPRILKSFLNYNP